MLADWRDPVDQMRREQRRREAAAKFAPKDNQVSDHRHELAREAERLAAEKLRALGYAVQLTDHKASYDLLIDGVFRIEVKAALYHPEPGRRGRYQANVRNRADLVLFLARSAAGDVWFVLPPNVAGRSVTIRGWIDGYRGKYAEYRARWGLVGEVLATVEARQIKINFS